jgi:hypothetical protein
MTNEKNLCKKLKQKKIKKKRGIRNKGRNKSQ